GRGGRGGRGRVGARHPDPAVPLRGARLPVGAAGGRARRPPRSARPPRGARGRGGGGGRPPPAVARRGGPSEPPALPGTGAALSLGRGLTETATARGADEIITETRWVPIGEALEMIRRGEIVDGKTIAGLFLAASALGGLA